MRAGSKRAQGLGFETDDNLAGNILVFRNGNKAYLRGFFMPIFAKLPPDSDNR
jgi:hypothetical protein